MITSHRRKRVRRLPAAGTLVLGLVLQLSCDSGQQVTPFEATPPDVTPPEETPSNVTLTILHTNDEHGWIEEAPETDGAAKLMGVWRDVEGYREDRPFLIMSGGDNWTGPAISTWFEGESTVDVMNAMQYSAAAIGNHEFDFKVAGLRDRIAQANFPYLSANIRLEGSAAVPDFVVPYVIQEVGGLRVGLVGLTTTSTSFSTFPTYVEDLDFVAYADALTEWVPQVWDAGADLVLVVAHICYAEMAALASVAHDLGVSVIGGGHCNQRIAEIQDGVALVQAGWQMANYARVVIDFDLETGEVTSLDPSVEANAGGTPDAVVESVVNEWAQAAAAELSQVIGYASLAIGRSTALHNLITDSWLFAYPPADIAMTNSGGVRQGIPAGDITRGTIVGVLPFQNTLLELELTGVELIDCLKGNTLVAGMSTIGGYFHADGSPLQMDSVYTVLTTDYLYARDDYNFSRYDADPIPTGLNYHQPTIAYIESLGTTEATPLQGFLDAAPRR